MKTTPKLRHGLVFLLLTATVLGFAATAASAQVIYDNGVGTTGKGYYADATAGSSYDIASGDIFTPNGGGTINAVDFSGEFYSGTPDTGAVDSFTLSLYSASTDTGVGALIIADTFSSYSQTQVGMHTVAATGAVLPVYQFDGVLQTPFTLTAHSTYYFSISDLSSTAPDNFAVTVTDGSAIPVGSSNLEYSLLSGGTTYQTDTATLAFQLKSEVIPEPSEWSLLVMGGLVLILARRCNRRAS